MKDNFIPNYTSKLGNRDKVDTPVMQGSNDFNVAAHAQFIENMDGFDFLNDEETNSPKSSIKKTASNSSLCNSTVSSSSASSNTNQGLSVSPNIANTSSLSIATLPQNGALKISRNEKERAFVDDKNTASKDSSGCASGIEPKKADRESLCLENSSINISTNFSESSGVVYEN